MSVRGPARIAVALTASLSLLPFWAAAGATAGEAQSSADPVSVVVREANASTDTAEHAVRRLGGQVVRKLAIIDGFTAELPSDRVDDLERDPAVTSVTLNAKVTLSGFAGYDPVPDDGSMYSIAQEVTGAGEFWNAGFRGQGVDVALIDSGVAPVEGLLPATKVMNGPDLSFESQRSEFRYTDTFGHGTHMAGIIAGRDSNVSATVQKGEQNGFVGMAPAARVISLKVADSHGNTDVSQVIAAIDWVVTHHDDPGMNIRVLNLSFGTDAVQDYRTDPLTYAAEVAWRAGIVVVVAAGNKGDGSAKLNNPAYDPHVIAVGGANGRNTYTVADDIIGDFSSWGDTARRPDLVAPGKSVVSLVSPGSRADVENPLARVGTRQIRGTGTSQAAAVVSGAAALIVSQRPDITPDQVKELMVSTAQELPLANPLAQGSGMLNLRNARTKSTPGRRASDQKFALATGTGSLEASRGTGHLEDDGFELRGEKDIFGASFNSSTWATRSAAGTAWSGGNWNANRWSGDNWSANRWSSTVWSANRWSGATWAADVWSANRWSANRWSGGVWLANRWSANRWSSDAWSSGYWG